VFKLFIPWPSPSSMTNNPAIVANEGVKLGSQPPVLGVNLAGRMIAMQGNMP
jgi:hypothetical protein